MKSEDFNKLIEIFGNHGGPGSSCEYRQEDHDAARKELTKCGPDVVEQIHAFILGWDEDYQKIEHKEQILIDILEVLAEIEDQTSISILRKIINRPCHMGRTWLNAAIALIKLGDETGVQFLKRKIKHISVPFDMKYKCAEALLGLGIRDLFHQDEEILSKTREEAEELERLIIYRLRRKD